MKKIEKLNAELIDSFWPDINPEQNVCLNKIAYCKTKALKSICDKVDELIDAVKESADRFDAADNQLANGGNCHAIEIDKLNYRITQLENIAQSENAKQQEQKPKQTCVQELTIKVNLDDESVEVIKANIDKVAKENERLKTQNDELRQLLPMPLDKTIPARSYTKFEDLQVGKWYLVKTKYGYFAGTPYFFDYKDGESFGLLTRNSFGTITANFLTSEIESIEELPE